LGVSGPPKKHEKLPKLQFFRPAGPNPLPDVGEIRKVHAGRAT